jgi:hypothetical protein
MLKNSILVALAFYFFFKLDKAFLNFKPILNGQISIFIGDLFFQLYKYGFSFHKQIEHIQ